MRYIRPILISILQIITFIGIYLLGSFVLEQAGYKGRRNLSWGLSVIFALYLFSIIVVAVNYVWVLKLSLRKKNAIHFVGMALFFADMIRDIGYVPYKVLFIMACALIGFLSKYLFDRILSPGGINKH